MANPSHILPVIVDHTARRKWISDLLLDKPA
jgi:hypothetical protein